MSRLPRLVAAAAFCAAVAAGCGIGPGDDEGEVELTVSRDYGSEVLLEEGESISEADTVLKVLDRNAELETRYGGGFVQSIDGLAGEASGGRRSDWFFYVNGIESPVGAAEYESGDGDRIWWDYRDWTAAMRVPAVVGSWPEPFVHGFDGERWKAALHCLRPSDACDAVSERLEEAGATVTVPFDETADPSIEIVVGTWARTRSDPVARLIAEGPAQSGVFATFTGSRRPLLNLLDDRGEPAGSLGRGAGLVAAVRPEEGPPTWLVTGTDLAGVEAAAGVVGDQLEDHYAVAVDRGGPIAVPVP